jgi:hypothetical protein
MWRSGGLSRDEIRPAAIAMAYSVSTLNHYSRYACKDFALAQEVRV